MRHFIVNLFLALFALTCLAQTNKKGTEVSYSEIIPKKYKGLPSGSSITLRDDSIYIFLYRGGFHKSYSFGTWKKDSKKRKLFLRGMFFSTDSIPLELIEKTMEGDSIRIDFNVFDDLVDWVLVINGTPYPIERNSSLSIKDVVRVDSLYVEGTQIYENVLPFLKHKSIRSLTYYPQKESNYFNISFPDLVNENVFYYIPMQDTLKIRGKKLIWEKKEWENKIRYKRKKSK